MGIDKFGQEGTGLSGVKVSYVNVQVDATAGVMVRIGANIKEGDPVGMKPNSREIVHSPVSGVVEFTTFDSDTHTLIVTIKEN